MSESERIGLDIDYADKSNLLLDMWIIAQYTAGTITTGKYLND